MHYSYERLSNIKKIPKTQWKNFRNRESLLCHVSRDKHPFTMKFYLNLLSFLFVEGAIGVNVAKGDLVILDGPYENYIDADIITGMCKRTDKISVMPRDLLYILPTPDEPASDSMVNMS